MSKIPLSIIIIHYKAEKDTLKLIAALANVSEIIIVDNSQSKTLKNDLRQFSNCRLIDNKINTGFAHACNQGLLASKEGFVLFLNSDLNISELQINQLLTELKKENLTAVSPTLLNDKNQLDFNYRKKIPSFFSLITEFSPLKKIIKFNKLNKITLPGACLLVDKSKFCDLGIWDERFFLWFEDSDISKKMLRQGHLFKISKKIAIQHWGGFSFKSLSMAWKKQVFFHSLHIYADKYFSKFECFLIKKLTSRFAKNILYPHDEKIRASIVVPNLKKNLLEKFLEKNVKHFDFSHDELIIVTSVSDLQQLRKKYPKIIFIQIKKNRGFAKTVNLGLKRARGKWLGTVNDDVILSEHWLENLLKEVERYSENKQLKIASISPLIKNSKNEIESLGVNVLPFGKAIPNKNLEDFKFTNSFNAAAVLFNRRALEEIGLFDEKFGSYLEDIDLGLRFNKKGYQNLAVKNVEIIHLGQQSFYSRPIYKAWLDCKNWWLVIIKNWTLKDLILNLPAICLERIKNLSGLIKAFF